MANEPYEQGLDDGIDGNWDNPYPVDSEEFWMYNCGYEDSEAMDGFTEEQDEE